MDGGARSLTSRGGLFPRDLGREQGVRSTRGNGEAGQDRLGDPARLAGPASWGEVSSPKLSWRPVSVRFP